MNTEPKDDKSYVDERIDEVKRTLANTPVDIREKAIEFLESPDLLERLLADIASLGVAGEHALAGAVYVAGTSRLLPEPLALLVQGSSSSGKSYVIDAVSRLMPPEEVVRATDITSNALYYLPPNSLRNRLVVAGERERGEDDELARKTKSLREMLSNGRLTKAVTGKSEDGNQQARIVEQEGPIAYIESTTQMRIFNEDANRMLQFPTDDTEEQTQEILQATIARRDATGTDRDRVVVDIHHTVQRLLYLGNRKVSIPFGHPLAKLFPSERIEARRAIKHVLTVIDVIALLHQRQRDVDSRGRIVATVDDYTNAARLLNTPMAKTLRGVIGPSSRRLLKRLRNDFGDGKVFDVPQVVQSMATSNESARIWVKELLEARAIEMIEPHRGQRPAKFVLTENEFTDASDELVLPSARQIEQLVEQGQLQHT